MFSVELRRRNNSVVYLHLLFLLINNLKNNFKIAINDYAL